MSGQMAGSMVSTKPITGPRARSSQGGNLRSDEASRYMKGDTKWQHNPARIGRRRSVV